LGNAIARRFNATAVRKSASACVNASAHGHDDAERQTPFDAKRMIFGGFKAIVQGQLVQAASSSAGI
jgi:uncharacterized protein YbaA (DUF1428 family)